VRKQWEHWVVVLGYQWAPRLASKLRMLLVKLRNPRARLEFGPGCYLGPGFSIHAPWGGTFIAGGGCEFRQGFRAELFGPDARIEMGSGCVFTYYSLIQCAGSVSLGERVMFGQASQLVDGNHRFRDLTQPMLDQGFDLRPIRIEDDVTTTTKCTIFADIGTRAFIGANSVVSRDIPPYTVAVGMPAKVVDYFGPPGMEPEGWEPRAGADGGTESRSSRSERSS
jgi:acetyltransferase-like isoleucine patch superfamily enzyme